MSLLVGMGRVRFHSFDNPDFETHRHAISSFSGMELVGTWLLVGPKLRQPLPRLDQLRDVGVGVLPVLGEAFVPVAGAVGVVDQKFSIIQALLSRIIVA